MNTLGSAVASTSSGGCGCGGGHQPSWASSGTTGKSGGCGGQCGGNCGCAGSAGVSGASAFVRPRFFGGMLLTEDDLQAIDDYTVAKRRLTNRHMFGPGVVCGLDVDCDPCKPGWVTVSPGYALDCCGNDIVVGCPESLDALALLSDLRRREGLDCGEPCDDTPRRGYLLVVSYTEQPTDPVAPYAQDDCAVGDCDYSRVREGYRFDLVCEVQEPDPSLFDRLSECAGQSDPRGVEAARLIEMAHLAKTQHIARAAEESGEAPAMAIPVVAEFGAARKEGIVPAAALLGRSTAVLAAAAAHDANLGPSIGLPAARRKAISDHTRQLAEDLLASGELDELSATERQRVTVVLNAAKNQENLEQLSAGQRIWLAEGYEAAEAARTFTADADVVRASIIHKLEQTGRGNCRERREVERLGFYQFDANATDTVHRLGQAYWSIVVGCLCDLANPPCPQCTETRVPLARVLIEGCEVVEVCALVRQWVLAPRSLNYWVPIVDILRRLLMERCCTRDYRRSTDRELDFLRRLWGQALSLVRSPLDSAQYSDLAEVLDHLPEEKSAATAGEPAPAGPEPAPAGGAATATAEAARVETLEKKVGELTEQLRKLTGGGTP
jgi:hypothetical protein